jgi:hypothetical protein
MFRSIHPSEPAGAMETRLEQVSGERWPLDVDALRRAQDPWECPEELLSWLAFNVGVDLWDDKWDHYKKRAVIAAMPRLLPLKGTPAGIREYLDLAGTPAVKMTLPPYGIYLGGEIEPDVYSAWLSRLPQIRVYFDRQFDVLATDTFFDVDHADELLATEDEGTRRRNHYATLYQDGQTIETISIDVRIRNTVDVIRITVNPTDIVGFMADTSCADGDDHIREDTFFSRAINAQINQGDLVADASAGSFETTMSTRAVDTKWSVVTGIHDLANGDAFLDVDCSEDGIAGADTAYNRVYRRLYVRDPAIPMPVPPTGMSVDGEYIDMPPFHGIVKVDTRRPAFREGLAIGRDFEGYLDVSADVGVDDAVHAVQLAQGGTDVFVIDTKIESQITAGDRLTARERARVGTLLERIN